MENLNSKSTMTYAWVIGLYLKNPRSPKSPNGEDQTFKWSNKDITDFKTLKEEIHLQIEECHNFARNNTNGWYEIRIKISSKSNDQSESPVWTKFATEMNTWNSVEDMYKTFIHYTNHMLITLRCRDIVSIWVSSCNCMTEIFDGIYDGNFKFKIGDKVHIRNMRNTNMDFTKDIYEVVELPLSVHDYISPLSGRYGYGLKRVGKRYSQDLARRYDTDICISEYQMKLI